MVMDCLDLVAISTCADLVPMQGENRIFVSLGIELIRRKPRLGIAALFREAKIYQQPDGRYPVDISTLSFVIAPRLNAAGRMDHGITAVELLSAYEERQARVLAARLENSNLRRREADTEITSEALAMIEADPSLKEARSTVLYNKDWNRGVIGIAASRVMEHYYRPTIILTDNQGKATGSARSVGDFDLYACVEACADLLDQWGGHTGAVGLTIDIGNVPAFRERFEKEVRARMKPGQDRPKLEADLLVDLSSISLIMLRQLYRIAPFGVHNAQPVFMATGLVLCAPVRVLNSKASGEPAHLSLVLQQQGNKACLPAIGFSMMHRLADVESGKPLEAIFTVQENAMAGANDGPIRLMLKDLRAEAF
jgi:single-stranded-DNA-specific exonuclease